MTTADAPTPRADEATSFRILLALALACALAAIAGCGWSAAPRPAAQWQKALHLHGVVDLTATRGDGRRVVSAAGRLWLLARQGSPTPFARGTHGYGAPSGDESYLALAPRGGCFGRDAVYALALGAHPAVVAVDRRGRARHFASLPSGAFLNGIAFDTAGKFGRSLLVTASRGKAASVFAIGCSGSERTVAHGIPKVEGGIAVAPRTFGRYGGDLIAPDENSGRIYAIDGHGRARLLVDSGLPHGGDVGVESAGFVPARVATALLADRGTPGNPHPGTDSILALTVTPAIAAPGDLLVASEGGTQTVAVRCGARCTVRHVADGPPVAHAEGHIAF